MARRTGSPWAAWPGCGRWRTLLLAAGKLVGIGVALVGDTPTLASSASATSVASPFLASTRRGASMMLSRMVRRPQVEVLKAKPISLRRRLICLLSAATRSPFFAAFSLTCRPPGVQDLALDAGSPAGDAAQESRLAGPGGTEDGDHVAVAGGQRHALVALRGRHSVCAGCGFPARAVPRPSGSVMRMRSGCLPPS